VREAAPKKVDEGEYEVKVEIDPVQYKQDLEGIVVTRAKFIEDIYSSDCQLVLHLEELRSHGEKLLTLRKLREDSSNNEVPKWLEDALLGLNSDADKITLIEGPKTSLSDHLSTLKEQRVLYLTRNAVSMDRAVGALSTNKDLKLLTPYSPSGLYTPAAQIKTLIAKRQHLLRDAVTVLAECLDYKVFPDYTCERAAIFFKNVVKPL
jgi:hypothetical protein